MNEKTSLDCLKFQTSINTRKNAINIKLNIQYISNDYWITEVLLLFKIFNIETLIIFLQEGTVFKAAC